MMTKFVIFMYLCLTVKGMRLEASEKHPKDGDTNINTNKQRSLTSTQRIKMLDLNSRPNAAQ